MYHFQRLFLKGENDLAATELAKLDKTYKEKLYFLTKRTYIHSLCLNESETVIQIYMQPFYKQWNYIIKLAASKV